MPPGSWQVTGTFYPGSSAGSETQGFRTHLELNLCPGNEAKQERALRRLPRIHPEHTLNVDPWSFIFWLIRDPRFHDHGLLFLWGLIWFNDSWHFFQHTLSLFTAVKNNSLSPWQQRRFIRCCQIDEQLWLSSVLTHSITGGTSRLIISNAPGTDSGSYRWTPVSNFTLSCVLCCFQQ